jgi:hypothetical protein|tara:strand:- start:431 stop:550 length:120 start_codon:yes stop_codon:yes gene_type:complete
MGGFFIFCHSGKYPLQQPQYMKNGKGAQTKKPLAAVSLD